MKEILIQHLLYSGLGGPGSVFFSLVEADRNKVFSYKAVFCGIEPVREEYKQSCERLGIPYEYVEKKQGLDLKVYAKLYQQFLRSRPSILFLHGVSLILPAIWYSIFKRDRKVIVRDTQAHHLKSKLEWVWLFLCILLADRIIVLTPEAAGGILKRFGWFARRSKIIVITNGMNVKEFQPGPARRSPKEVIIGMQSRLQPIKDHPTLIRAFMMLKKKLPDHSLVLEIAGDGVTRQSITEVIDELNISDSVKMRGMLNSKDLISFMKSLDIYVHATFGETLSNSIMQAMACGLPIIASDVAGVSNMVKNGETGVLYESGNALQLAELLEHLILDTNKRQRLGSNARIFAENNYSDNVMFERYRTVFKDVTKKVLL